LSGELQKRRMTPEKRLKQDNVFVAHVITYACHILLLKLSDLNRFLRERNPFLKNVSIYV